MRRRSFLAAAALPLFGDDKKVEPAKPVDPKKEAEIKDRQREQEDRLRAEKPYWDRKAVVSERTTVLVGPGKPPERVDLVIGETLMWTPWETQWRPRYVNVMAGPERAPGDDWPPKFSVLDLVGEVKGGESANRTYRPGFMFYAVAPGSMTVRMWLTDTVGNKIEDQWLWNGTKAERRSWEVTMKVFVSKS
jgi:hypothetical protein